LTFPKAEYQVPRTRLMSINKRVCFDIPESRVPSTKDQAEVDQDRSLFNIPERRVPSTKKQTKIDQ
jgi:hypothetical protein